MSVLAAGALILAASSAFAQSEPDADTETDSSTTAFPLPGEGGGLPRAPMPTGGVDDGSQDALQKRIRDSDPDVDPEYDPVDEEHCHEHSHDGDTHEHCHDDIDDAHAHEHADDDDVDPKPTPKPKARAKPTPEAVALPAEAEVLTEEAPRGAAAAFGTQAEEMVVGGIKVRWNGYLRLAGEVIENDSKSQFIGRNDGFKLANARLGLQARKGDFSAYISLEAAAGESDSFNDPNSEFRVMPRDAYLRYDVSKFARVTAGRFKTPYDLSSLEATALRTFIERPVESRGVLPTQGYEVAGMATDRQLGIMIHKERIGLFNGGFFDAGYALALTNGRTNDLSFNDNDRPAAFMRLSAYFGDWAAVNLAGFADTRTVGDLPNLFDEDVKGIEVSALAAAFDFKLEAQLLWQNTQFETSGRSDVASIGGHVQVAYSLWDISFAYRFAFFDPNTNDIEDADRVIEHTLGVGYGLTKLPLRFLLNGTVAQEQAGRKLANNRITLLAQFIF